MTLAQDNLEQSAYGPTIKDKGPQGWVSIERDPLDRLAGSNVVASGKRGCTLQDCDAYSAMMAGGQPTLR